MQIGIVVAKDAEQKRKLFKGLKIWFIISSILSLICIVIFLLEVSIYGSGYSLVPLLILTPWLPGAIIYSVFKEMKRVPSAIYILSDRSVFHYHLGFMDRDITMFWGDVVEFIPYDHIRDRKGQMVRFPPLERKDMDLIVWTLKKIERLDIDQGWQVRNLDETISRVLENPTGQTSITKKAWRRTAQLSVLLVISLILLYGGMNGMYRAIVFRQEGYFAAGMGFLVVFLPTTVLLIIGIFQQVRKREIHVDGNGVRYFYAKKVRYRVPWHDIDMISNIRANNTETMFIHLKTGRKKRISSAEFNGHEIRKAFEIMKGYCYFHNVKIDNRLGW
ncbi:MAG: hypothetical protein ACMUHM_08970 [Thermoplasmatota archaeon]